jgi:GT2 family glycosyltransferase
VDISVVIVNYNVREFLRGALVSLRKSLAASGLEGEVFVVDNASRDGSQEMVAKEFPDVRLYALKENIGFGRANNLALRDAQGEYLLILNPDTILGEDTLRVMVDFMRAHPDAGAAGCKLLNGDGSFQLSCRRGFPTPWASFTKLFGLSKLFPKSELFAKYNLTYLSEDETYEIDALVGAFMLLSRKAYELTGGFDESYFMYGEDLDLSYRIKQAGLKNYYVASTSTIHFKGESTKRSTLNEVKVFYEAMHIFVKRHYGRSRIFSLLLRLGIAARSAVALVKKYRGALALAAADAFAVNVSILVISKIIFGAFRGLPDYDYPWVFLVPPAVVVACVSIVGGYQRENRRNSRYVLFAMPAALIVMSSLTYFFKEFIASRSLILMITGVATFALILVRVFFRLVDRFRYGGEGTAKPRLRRTLVAGTGEESLRIAALLQSSGFTKRYELVGFLSNDLTRVGEQVLGSATIRGDLGTLSKIIRDDKIEEVIFPSDAFAYSEMLEAMQRVSNQAPTEVSFNVVPHATDVLLSRSKIEVISPPPAHESLAVMPLEYNVHRLSHRFVKRCVDILVALLALPLLGIVQLVHRSPQRRQTLSRLTDVLRGRLSLVGIHPARGEDRWLCKEGVISLADLSNGTATLRSEDVEQMNLYYARHHTFGMDVEILLRSIFARSGG